MAGSTTEGFTPICIDGIFRFRGRTRLAELKQYSDRQIRSSIVLTRNEVRTCLLLRHRYALIVVNTTTGAQTVIPGERLAAFLEAQPRTFGRSMPATYRLFSANGKLRIEI